MADVPSNPDFFDLERIRLLIELMNQHGMTEINLRQGDARIQLRRGGETVVAAAPGYTQTIPVPPLTPPVKPPITSGPGEGEPKPEPHIVEIKSPMVGTFYSAPDPDSPPYVKVGDPVGPDTIVCIVEAMKVFNQIPAEVSGRIEAVLVENGAPVEFGQPIFKVNTRQ